jgi:hypothetical protein
MNWKRLIPVIAVVVAGACWAAEELTLSGGWTYNKNGRKRTLASTTSLNTITGNYVIENVQLISTNTVGDALEMGGVTTAGFAYFHNSDATNYIEIGVQDASTNFCAFLKLASGQNATVWLGTTAPYARANTNSIKLDYVITDR